MTPAHGCGAGKRLRRNPLSAQAKPGRPSGVDKKQKFSERARGRTRGDWPCVHRLRLVGLKGHGRLEYRLRSAWKRSNNPISSKMASARFARKKKAIDGRERPPRFRAMKILAVSGSARRNSTNSAMLRAVSDAAPNGVEVLVFDGIAQLPVFSPDFEGKNRPAPVRAFANLVAHSDGIVIASPEYVRSIPGGLKNAIDWLVSGEELIRKPIALMHGSHRGDDMLASLRTVLSTVSERFSTEIFLRFPLMKMEPDDVRHFIDAPENRAKAQAYLRSFADFCLAEGETACARHGQPPVK